jgi:hypothetical protein
MAQLPTIYPIHAHYISLNYPPTPLTQAIYLHHPFSKKQIVFQHGHHHCRKEKRLLKVSSTLKLRSNSCIKVYTSCRSPTMLVLQFLEVLQPMEDRRNNFVSLFNVDNENMAFFVHKLSFFVHNLPFYT